MKDKNYSPPKRDFRHKDHDSAEEQRAHRGEIFSQTLKYSAKGRCFFNLKENREANLYLNIVDSSERDGGRYFKRRSILIFAEQRQDFVRECLAALEALAAGKNFQSVVESQQRQFSFQIQTKSHGTFLSIREETTHYGKPLREQLFIPQNSASTFSQILIETVEKWLEYERSEAKRQKNMRLTRRVRPQNPQTKNYTR